MRCRELVELVADYLDNVLPAERRAQFDAHLEGCEDCSAYVDQLRQTSVLVGRLPDEPLPTEVADRLVELFRDWKSA